MLMGLLSNLLLLPLDYLGEVEGDAGRGKKAGGREGWREQVSYLHSLTTIQIFYFS